MSTRYLFLCPDINSASGGVAVIYDMVSLLNRAGYEAAVLHNSPSAGYPDYPHAVPAYYTRRLWRTHWRYAGLRGKLAMARKRFTARKARLRPLSIRPTDVIIVPEYLLAEAIEAFYSWPLVVFVQNPFALMRAYKKALQRGNDPSESISFWLGMSDVCRSHMTMLNCAPSAYFPVSMKPHEFPFKYEKQPLITYMPRKRLMEAEIIVEALERRGKVSGYRIEALDNISRAEVAAKLAHSLVFVSLLQHESLGFPAAEAMASGCVVVGFDGLGGAEFFDNTTGVPVTEGDVAGVVEAVEQVVREYEKDPVNLDALRKHASQVVNKRYSTDAFEAGAIAAWAKVDKYFAASITG